MTDACEPHEGPEPDRLEELGELRALYRRLEPPPLADGLDELDPETARAVRWARDAWRGLETPAVPATPLAPARPPLRLADRRPRRLHRALAAAAVLLVALGAFALWRARRAQSRPARLADGHGATPGGVEVLAALPDRIELRSGPVRLVLLEPAPARPMDDHSGS